MISCPLPAWRRDRLAQRVTVPRAGMNPWRTAGSAFAVSLFADLAFEADVVAGTDTSCTCVEALRQSRPHATPCGFGSSLEVPACPMVRRKSGYLCWPLKTTPAWVEGGRSCQIRRLGH